MIQESAEPRRLRVLIAGGGICGGLLAMQLRKASALSKGEKARWDVICYEKGPRTGGPPGVNLLLCHNAAATLKAYDEVLWEQRLKSVGDEMRMWQIRSTTGDVLFTEDVVESGLADSIGLRARWDHFVEAIRVATEEIGGGGIVYDSYVESYRYSGNDETVVVTVRHKDGSRKEEVVDLLVACDGRFSNIRAQVEGGKLPTPDVMDVANFKFMIPDTVPDGVLDDHVRIYNIPDRSHLVDVDKSTADDPVFVEHCMGGLARVGIMRMKDAKRGNKLGIYGNFSIPRGAAIPESAKTAGAMRALFTPKEGVDAMDPLARYVFDKLVSQATKGDIHWERFQEVPARMSDDRGRVLILGDASHAFAPSLGQGASVAIEDACVAGLILHQAAAAGARNLTKAVAAVENLRLPRVEKFARLSRHHAGHISPGFSLGDEREPEPERSSQQVALDALIADWTLGARGGTLCNDRWRDGLAFMWKEWPRPDEAVQALERANRPRLCCGVQ